MLVNAAEGFWGIGDDEQVAAVCGHALTLPESPAHNLHRILLAAAAVMRQDLPRARSYMEQVNPNKLDPDYSFITTVVQGVLEMEAAEAAKRADVFRQVSKRMDRARNEYAAFPHGGTAAALSDLSAASRPAARRYRGLAMVYHAVDGVVGNRRTFRSQLSTEYS